MSDSAAEFHEEDWRASPEQAQLGTAASEEGVAKPRKRRRGRRRAAAAAASHERADAGADEHNVEVDTFMTGSDTEQASRPSTADAVGGRKRARKRARRLQARDAESHADAGDAHPEPTDAHAEAAEEAPEGDGGVFIVAFSSDKTTFSVTHVAKVKRAARSVYAAASESSDCRDAKELASRIREVLRARADGADDAVYVHPVADSDTTTVRYMVMNASMTAPRDASEAMRLWKKASAAHAHPPAEYDDDADDDGAEEDKDEEGEDGPQVPSKGGRPGRSAHVVAFTRDGTEFNVATASSLVEAARIVYAAAGSTRYRDARALHGHVYTLLHRAETVYLHPAGDGDDVVRYMIMYASTRAPRNVADAIRTWDARKAQVTDALMRPSAQLATARGRPGRVTLLIAFGRAGSSFNVKRAASLLEAARFLFADAKVMAYRDPMALYFHIYGILHASGTPGDTVYLHPPSIDRDVVRYMVMYGSETAPRNAVEARRMWERRGGYK